MSEKLPATLEPTGSVKLTLPSGATVSVGIATPTFQRWTGAPPANTFGGKPLVDTGGRPEFAELAILRCFERAGWVGRWLESYAARGNRPHSFLEWQDCKLRDQVEAPIADEGAVRLMERIARAAGGVSGWWDVLAWKNGRYVFAEAKQSRKDAIRENQKRWLETALQCGCVEEDFVVVEWSFSAA
jgi:hypothetical protein